MASVAISSDGNTIVSGGETIGNVYVWNMSDGALLRTFTDTTGHKMRVVISPDGSRIVSGGADSLVMVWSVSPPTAIDSEHLPLPSKAALLQNVPNPFNPTTRIPYALASDGGVRLTLYDVTGRYVRTPVDGYRWTGRYSVVWDGRDEAGRSVGSGVYIVRMTAGETSLRGG